MANPEQRQLDLSHTYVHLADGGAAPPIEVGPQFWQRDVRRYEDGRLVFAYRFEKDADHWDVHPQGEELVCVLSGAVEADGCASRWGLQPRSARRLASPDRARAGQPAVRDPRQGDEASSSLNRPLLS